MFDFPKANRALVSSFKKNYLKTAVFQCKYPSNNQILEKKEDIYNLLKNEFPRKQENSIHDVTITGKEPSWIKSEYGIKLITENGQIIIDINTDGITLTISGNFYTNVDDQLKVLSKFNEIFSLANIHTLNRIAIRKINLVPFDIKKEEHAASTISKILNPSLINNIQEIPSSKAIFQNIDTLNFKNHKKNHNLNIKFGFLLDETNLSKGNVILDIDLYRLENQIKTSELLDTLMEINSEVYNIFCWSLNKSALENLR